MTPESAHTISWRMPLLIALEYPAILSCDRGPSVTTWTNTPSSLVTLSTSTLPHLHGSGDGKLAQREIAIQLIPAASHWRLAVGGHKSSSQHQSTPTTPQRTKESYKMVTSLREDVGTSDPRRRGHA